MDELVRDISLSIAAAWVLGLFSQQFHQPILLAYLVAGFVLGPVGSRLIASAESLRRIQEITVILESDPALVAAGVSGEGQGAKKDGR